MKSTWLVIAIFLVGVFSGCGKSGSSKNPIIENIRGPNVSFIDGRMTLSVAILNLKFDYGARIPIPKMSDSFIEVGPDFQSSGFLITVGIAISDIQKHMKDKFKLLDPLTLPGGRPLPGTTAGFLPGVAVQLDQKFGNLAFYLGANLFGTFVPVKLPFKDIITTFRFYDGVGDRIGNISVIGTDKDKKNSGILVLIDLTGKIQNLVMTGKLR